MTIFATDKPGLPALFVGDDPAGIERACTVMQREFAVGSTIVDSAEVLTKSLTAGESDVLPCGHLAPHGLGYKVGDR